MGRPSHIIARTREGEGEGGSAEGGWVALVGAIKSKQARVF
jgi:hypothetical protein